MGNHLENLLAKRQARYYYQRFLAGRVLAAKPPMSQTTQYLRFTPERHNRIGPTLNPLKYALTFLLIIVLLAAQAEAGSSTWSSAPASGNWNTSTNWAPATVPNGPSDVATFQTSNTLAVSLSADAEVSAIVFNAGANAFTFTAPPTFTLTVSGSGVTNNSGVQQNFVSAVNSVGQYGWIKFVNNAGAGSLTKFTIRGCAPERFFPGLLEFYNNATAGSATIISDKSQASQVGGSPGILQFWDNSSAGTAAITNVGGSVNGESGGYTYFNGTSTGGNATFTIDGAGAGGASGGQVRFLGNSTGGNATFNVNGSSVTFTNPGILMFTDNSSLGNAFVIGNGGTNGGPGGFIYIFGDSNGPSARVQLNGNSSLDVSSHSATATVAQLEGSGDVILGLTNLTIGGNNVSTTLSGVIQAGPGVSGGSLTKVGTGTLTLGNANTHTGVTALSTGTLKLTNALALQLSILNLGVSTLVFDSSVTPHAFTFGGLAGSANLNLRDNAASPHAVALSVGGNDSDTLYSGGLTGTGSLTKIGAGTVTLSGLNSYSGTTTVSNGRLVVNGSLTNSSAVAVGSGSILSGAGTINGPVTVNSGGEVLLTGGTLTVNNKITNNGLFIVGNGSQLAGVTSFINNGTLDLITAPNFTPPNGFVNHGTIITSSVVKPKGVIKDGQAFTMWVDSFTGHTYHLLKSTSPAGGSFVEINTTPPQQGQTGLEVTLTDIYSSESRAFYRLQVNP
jgi:autotransporter-associated beta strand protein